MTENQTMDNTNAATLTPDNVESVVYDERVIRKIIGAALEGIPGILGPSGGVFSGIADSFKKVEDVDITKGLHFSYANGVADVKLKVIAELGQQMPEIVNEITSKVTTALKEQAGMDVESMEVEIVDTMTREEYESKFRTPKDESKHEE